jgi:hypothetical protein
MSWLIKSTVYVLVIQLAYNVKPATGIAVSVNLVVKAESVYQPLKVKPSFVEVFELMSVAGRLESYFWIIL